ncbi:hypothetical protein KBX73_03020 [Acetobacter persici]|uniref:hypothetical protein n=1 Tax=Acetobacter persici TaxID=1076596 RepID=UPI0020CCFBD8|nr:hypothetical protein [Acetobacter persici]MCP9318763.1 hypothetical protein [Acetobacter persici]
MTDNLHNAAPFLDLVTVVNQIKNNTVLFRDVSVASDPKKLIGQIGPDKSRLPFIGLTEEFGEVTSNPINGSMVQVLTIDVCCTIVLDTEGDLTGAGSLLCVFDDLLKDLMHCIYNWRPEKTRYINGFSLNRFERIAGLCSNTYEVYCVYFSIPTQIDYLDGYLTEGQKLQVISTQLQPTKTNQFLIVNTENKS